MFERIVALVSGERILIVDDEPWVLRSCAILLAREGYQVSVASGGREALAELAGKQFDLFLVDLKMPDVDGLAVLQRARDLQPNVTAVIITGYGTADNAIQALRAGARDFLLKPFQAQDLVQAIDKALAARRREEEYQLLRARLSILEISQALIARGDMESLAGRLLEVVVEQLGAERALLFLLDEDADQLYLVGSLGPLDEAVHGTRIPADEGIAGQALLQGKPLLLDLPSTASQAPARQGSAFHLGTTAGLSRVSTASGLDRSGAEHPQGPGGGAGPISPAICAPLCIGKRAIGLLDLRRRAGDAPFSPSDLNLLTIVSSQIAMGLENARLYEALQRELADRMRAEEVLKASEERYRLLAENAQDIIYRFRIVPDRGFDYVSPAVAAITGYTPEEYYADSSLPFKLVHPDDVAQLKRSPGDKGTQRQPGVVRVQHRNGSKLWIELRNVPIYDAAGNMVAIEGVARDVTDRQRIEKALRGSEHKFRSVVERSVDGIVLADERGIVIEWNEGQEQLTGLKRTGAIGLPVWDVLSLAISAGQHPQTLREQYRETTLEFLKTGQAPWLNQLIEGVIQRPDGTQRATQAVMFPIETERGFMSCSICRDVTERRRAEEELRRSLEERARSQRLLLALNQAAQEVQRGHTPDQVYRTIGEELVRLGYQALVLTLTGDRAHLGVSYLTFEPTLVQAVEKLAGFLVPALRIPLRQVGAFQRILGEEEAHFASIADFVNENVPEPVRPLLGQVAAMLGLDQAIAVPLAVGGETIGLLLVVGTGLTEADVPAVTAFANQATIALENAELFEKVCAGREQLQNLSHRLVDAQEAERRRIARELHDEIGQILTGLKLVLGMSIRLPADAIQDAIVEAQVLVNELITRVRDLSLDLRPAMLDDLGLLPALLWHFERIAALTHVDVTFKHTGLEGRRFAPEVETAVYRIVQEALTNVARHAAVNEATVRVWADEETLNVQVEDRGNGFDPEAVLAAAATSGLAGMYERVRLLAGQLTVESTPGDGTLLTAELPLDGR